MNGIKELIDTKSKERSTYYVSGKNMLSALPSTDDINPDNQEDISLSAPPHDQSALPLHQSAPPLVKLEVSDGIKQRIQGLGKKSDKAQVKEIVVLLCNWQELSAVQISTMLGKSEKYVLREYITSLRTNGEIEYSIPDMANHPNQAYKAN